MQLLELQIYLNYRCLEENNYREIFYDSHTHTHTHRKFNDN